jgi:hypothetical protein
MGMAGAWMQIFILAKKDESLAKFIHIQLQLNGFQ